MAERRSRKRPVSAVRRSVVILGTFTVLSTLLSIAAAAWLIRAALLWPAVAYQRIEADPALTHRMDQAYARRLRQSPDLFRAVTLTRFGDLLLRSWRGPQDPAQLAGQIARRRESVLPGDPVAGLYDIAATLLRAERDPSQRQAAQTRVVALLRGLPDGPWSHGQIALIRARIDATREALAGHFASFAWAASLAWLEADHPHNPLVEYLTPRLAELADRLDAGGDHALAARCRRVLYRWLAAWISENGPPGLRVLAADRLASLLERWRDLHPPAELIAALRNLRQAYRTTAGRWPADPFDLPGRPALAPDAAGRLLTAASWAAWIASANAAALLALLAVGVLRLRRRSEARPLAFWTAPLIAVVLIALGRLAAPWATASSLRIETTTEMLRWAGVCLAAPAAAVFATVVIAAARRRNTVALAAGLWLGCSIGLVVGAWSLRAASVAYVAALEQASADPLKTLAGPALSAAQTRLQRWQPPAGP